MAIRELVETFAAVATSVGVFFVVWQLWQTKKQAVTSFEDQLASEYRLLARAIPASALLGEELENEKFLEAREYVYNYIDLSNEQVFLRQIGRVTKERGNIGGKESSQTFPGLFSLEYGPRLRSPYQRASKSYADWSEKVFPLIQNGGDERIDPTV